MNRKIMAAGLAVLAIPIIIFPLAPSVMVRDPTGQVSNVVVVNDHYFQRLYRLPGGVFFGLPKIEGAIEIQCVNGLKSRNTYSSGQMHRFETVDPGSVCDRTPDSEGPPLSL